MARLADVVEAMDEWFDPRWAESWDAVGLVCGDPAEDATRILLAVDPTPDVVADALAGDLLVTHHPLLLTGVHGVPADDPKGALVHRMIRGRTAHFVAHTNADVARPGVSDALADRLGLLDLRPLEPASETAVDKLVVYVPIADAERVIAAVAAAGAGTIGSYDRCAWITEGVGTFRPLDGSNPTIGAPGEIERVAEARVELVAPRARQAAVVAALRAAHPYEEPAFDLLAQAPLPSRRGTGRVGRLPQPTTLRELTALAARVLPATAWGVRAAGDPDRRVETIAVCGGSGASYIADARAAGADAYLTADLKHHVTSETVDEQGGPALLDAAHWATEAPWLDALAQRLRARFGTTVDVTVSRRRTDPWTVHAPSNQEETV